MTIAHAGASRDDPRNHGLIDMFRPVEYTPTELQARMAAIAARVTNEITKARILERAAKVTTTQFRPAPPMSRTPGAYSRNEFASAAHPDLVTAIRRLNTTLPVDCLCLFFGRPALVHPLTGVVFGLAIGSIGIAARIPAAGMGDAVPYRRSRTNFDLRAAGPEWLLVDPRDDAWCEPAYEDAGHSPKG
jgi:hypothetical protein